ncbi:MAG: hypothetical protein GY909_14280 [Oligoflexia bacterium]|nr:hypothetical protein [Oligoflexia bacterium]
MVLDIIFFIVKYIPFWSVPSIMIGLQFGYIYWLKDVFHLAYAFYSLAGFSLLSIIYYIYAGSPEKAVSILDNMIRNF